MCEIYSCFMNICNSAIMSIHIIMYFSYTQEDSVHDSLAIAVSNAILSDPTTTDIRVYCRSLSLVELTPNNQVCVCVCACTFHSKSSVHLPLTNQANASDLLVLWEKMVDNVTDRTSLRYLSKYGAMLMKLCPDYSRMLTVTFPTVKLQDT